MKENHFKILTIFIVFLLVFLPFINLFMYVFFLNFQLSNIEDLWNFVAFSLDKRLVNIFLRTIVIGSLTATFSIILGFALAYLLEFVNIKHPNIWRAVLFTPFLIPAYFFVFSWLGFLGKRGTFTSITFQNIQIDVYNPAFLIFFLTLSFFPIAMFIISLGLKNINMNLIDAGRLSKSKKVLKKIILPLIKPHLIASFFIVFSLTVSDYTTSSFLRINTYQGEIFDQLAVFYNTKMATIYSIPLLLFSFGVSFCFYYYLKGKRFVTISGMSRKKVIFVKLKNYEKVLVYTFFLSLLLFSLGIPILMLFIESEFQFSTALLATKNELISSLVIGGVSSLLITILGFFIFHFFKENNLLNLIIIFPLTIPATVIGISLIDLYSTTPIYGNVVLLIICYITRFLPFSILILSPFLTQLSQNLEESAKLSTGNFLKIFWKILLPLSKGGFVLSFIIVFILCLTEISITQMLAPAGFQTLAMRIDTLMHYANYSFVASLSLILLILIIFLYSIYIIVYGEIL